MAVNYRLRGSAKIRERRKKIIKGILYVTAILLFQLPFQAHSQCLISGKVTDSIHGVPLYPATIFNITSGQAVYADSLGNYKIIAQNGDKIEYRYLGFSSKKYTVPGGFTHIVHNVVLISKRVKLKAIEVQAQTPYQQDSLERIKTFGHYLNLPIAHFFGGSSGGIGVSMHPITYFSKKERRKRRFHKMYKQFEKDAFIDSRYTRKLVHKLTGMAGDSLRIFMYKVRPDYNFTRHSPDLLFWSWILRKYKAWTHVDSLKHKSK